MPTSGPTSGGPGSGSTVLITGASSGIGLAFARAYAERGCSLVLVAIDGDRLDEVAQGLRDRLAPVRPEAVVETLTADLATTQGLDDVCRRVRERPVDVLVNNAGFGTGRRFVGSDLEAEVRLLDVLARAVLVVTHAALEGMLERGSGRVVTVASAAAFLPGGSYTAAKAWAVAFSRGLAYELAGSGVTATVVCPGFVRTDFHRRAALDLSGLPRLAWLEADDLVARALRDVVRGRVVSVPTLRYRLAVAAVRHLPLRLADARGTRAGTRRARRRKGYPDDRGASGVPPVG
jgi:short-subunit dehydrogenase